MRLIIAITTWFLSGAIALDVSSTVTYISTSVFFEPLHVSGILTLLDTVLFAAIPFTVDALAYFFLRNTSPSTIRTSDMVNNGYALFDVSGTSSVYIPFQNSNQNNGEFIVYGQDLNVAMYGVENEGSMTFWGDTGSISIDGITNAGTICFHNQLGNLYRPGGKGSCTLSQFTVFANSVQSDFEPRITFEGSDNGFVNQNGDSALYYTLVNFGDSNYVAVPNQGYIRYTVNISDGIFTMFMSSNQIVFDIGLGYSDRFNVTTTSQFIYFSYLDAAPGTANSGGSVCELNLNSFGGGSTSSVEGSSSSEVVEPTSEESTEIETTSGEVETSTEVVISTSDIEESTQGDTTIDEATSVVTTTDIDTTTPVVEESTTPEPASSEFEEISTLGTSEIEPNASEEETTSAVSSVTESSSVGSSSSSTPRPPNCKKVNGKWKGNCPGHGHDSRSGKGHGNDYNNGHGNDHNNGHDNGHGNDHGNSNNKGNNKNNNYDNGNRHGNDHDNKNGNSNGKGKGNDNKDNNGHGKGNGKGHKQEAIQENSTSWANKRISVLLVIALFLTVII